MSFKQLALSLPLSFALIGCTQNTIQTSPYQITELQEDFNFTVSENLDNADNILEAISNLNDSTKYKLINNLYANTYSPDERIVLDIVKKKLSQQ